MMYKLEFLPEAKKEKDKLEGSVLVFVEKGLNRIKVLGMQAGQPLHGKLAGCHKLKNKRLGLRIVFRSSPNGIEIIQIVAIGKRDKLTVYRDAEKRINQR